MEEDLRRKNQQSRKRVRTEWRRGRVWGRDVPAV
jgi:hypothetical protein